MYKLYSTYFLENDVEQYNCYVNNDLWKRITNDLMANRILIRINANTNFWICSLGQPIYTTFDSSNHIYVPKWMLEQINCEGVGESVTLDWFPSEVFDHSTKIILQPHESIIHIENIQEILSYELTKLAVLKKGSTIQVIMDDSKLPLKFEVVGLEPASIVLCEGDEVELEFMESLDSISQSCDVVPSAPSVEPSVSASTLGGVQREGRFNPWRTKGFMPKSS